MKLGILTQRLHVNYGGLLQCFALQTTLNRMGHEAEVLQRWFPKNEDTLRNRLTNRGKQLALLVLQRKWCHYTSEEEERIIAQYTNQFIDKYITPRSPRFYNTESMKQYVEENGFEGYVVGSDQVWRPCYSPCIGNYFLDFAKNKQVKRISYAASFGVDENEYSESQLQQFAPLLMQFDAVSVRESSGIKLCEEYFKTKAQLVLDPTLFLDRKDYEQLIANEQEPQSDGNLFCYILDESPVKKEAIRTIEEKQHLKSFRVMPMRTDKEHLKASIINNFVYPSVTKWLKAFQDAEMVLTDSFHGCVFSIIFNKPFWVIGNEGRGLARFHSLLVLFGLENRLLTPLQLSNNDWMQPINWVKVNEKRDAMRMVSLEFLIKALQS